ALWSATRGIGRYVVRRAGPVVTASAHRVRETAARVRTEMRARRALVNPERASTRQSASIRRSPLPAARPPTHPPAVAAKLPVELIFGAADSKRSSER